MPSDKHNLTIAIANGLITTLLCLETCVIFANGSSSNACIMVLPKLTFVLLCTPFFSLLRQFLSMHVMALVQVQCKQGHFSHYSLLEMLAKCSKNWKQNEV